MSKLAVQSSDCLRTLTPTLLSLLVTFLEFFWNFVQNPFHSILYIFCCLKMVSLTTNLGGQGDTRDSGIKKSHSERDLVNKMAVIAPKCILRLKTAVQTMEQEMAHYCDGEFDSYQYLNGQGGLVFKVFVKVVWMCCLDY